MTVSIFCILIVLGVVCCSYLKYKSWVSHEDFREKLKNDKGFMKLYEEYKNFVEQNPDFNKHKTEIENFMKGKN